MKNFKNIVLSCEHAGNFIPRKFKAHLNISSKVLNSHLGLDNGADFYSSFVEEALKIRVSRFYLSRLLIEGNRPLHHPDLFSKYSKGLPKKLKDDLINNYYLPHWKEVEMRCAQAIKLYGNCIHLGLHSFTPVFHGFRRETEIGILYDPNSAFEKSVALRLYKEFKKTNLTISLNKPYKGIGAALVTHLRKKLKGYAGIELEVNQKFFRGGRGERISRLISDILKDGLK